MSAATPRLRHMPSWHALGQRLYVRTIQRQGDPLRQYNYTGCKEKSILQT